MKLFLVSILGILFSIFSVHANKEFHFEPKVYHIYNQQNDRVEHQTRYTPIYEGYEFHNGPERIARMNPKDIQGKSILDMGCNNGDLLFAAKKAGAGSVVGVDFVASLIQDARKTAKDLGIEDSQFIVGDMENKSLYLNLEPRDTVFFMRILDTSNFENRTAVIAGVARLAKEVMYYEGHRSEKSHVPRLYQLLTWTDFSRYEYLGKSKDGRPMIRCSRETMTPDQMPKNAITSDDPDHLQYEASEIYVLQTSPFNPVFSEKCRVIQYVK